MTFVDLPKFPTRHGHMSEKIQRDYIAFAIAQDLMPAEAHRIPEILSLTAPSAKSQPIQFWQLFSVLGQGPIVGIVQSFYERVFADEAWFKSVFEQVGGVNHHINTQASMWIDVMGGGPYYQGAEYRLNFHHYHNAFALMNDQGAARWSDLMLKTLDATQQLLGDDARVRTSINTFLSFFMDKYAADFAFENRSAFGETNGPYNRRINLMNMTSEAIEQLSHDDLRDALARRGVDVEKYAGKAALVNKALML